jgi:prepilin-type N-terminal cleavage/methylation domain-containing protein
MVRRLGNDEAGFTLIEVLIAMTVMSIAIAGIVAGFSSSILAVNRARSASTAGVLADMKMEAYRQSPATLPSVGAPVTSTPTGSDGRRYWMQVAVTSTCTVGTYSAGPPESCSVTPPASNPARLLVKLVTITVRDGSPAARVLFSENATFDSSTG